MGAGEVTAALVGLLGALVGAAAGYLGAVRAASRANRPAWATVAIEASRSLLESEDPAHRAEGSRLLEAAAAAIAGAQDAPEQLRRATRGRHRASVLESARAQARSSGSPVEFTVTPLRERTALPGPSAPEHPGEPGDPGVVAVSVEDVDAARAEVRAFRAAGVAPDPLVEAMASARPSGGD